MKKKRIQKYLWKKSRLHYFQFCTTLDLKVVLNGYASCAFIDNFSLMNRYRTLCHGTINVTSNIGVHGKDRKISNDIFIL